MNRNSIEIYKTKIRPKLSDRQKVILEVLQALGEATCFEVAIRLGTFPHRISGRFSELSMSEHGTPIIESVGMKMHGKDNWTIWKLKAVDEIKLAPVGEQGKMF